MWCGVVWCGRSSSALQDIMVGKGIFGAGEGKEGYLGVLLLRQSGEFGPHALRQDLQAVSAWSPRGSSKADGLGRRREIGVRVNSSREARHGNWPVASKTRRVEKRRTSVGSGRLPGGGVRGGLKPDPGGRETAGKHGGNRPPRSGVAGPSRRAKPQRLAGSQSEERSVAGSQLHRVLLRGQW